jgi:hypothetical protein
MRIINFTEIAKFSCRSFFSMLLILDRPNF